MFDAGTPVDCVLLSHHLEKTGKIADAGGYSNVTSLPAECPSAANMPYYARLVKEHYDARLIGFAIEQATKDINDRRQHPGLVAAYLTERMQYITAYESMEFKSPLPFSKLPETQANRWVVTDLISRGYITLFVALWKSGKTTLESILLHHLGLEHESEFLGKTVTPGKALVISEEASPAWISRRDYHSLGDNVQIMTREMLPVLDQQSWPRFCRFLSRIVERDNISIVVIDTLSTLWPVRDENDNAEVANVLKPLRLITIAGAAVALLHHPAKSDNGVGKLARGASSLLGDADIVIEMRRDNEQDLSDRRRKFDYFGRFGLGQIMAELSPCGCHYRVLGTVAEVKKQDQMDVIEGLLPIGLPGITAADLKKKWPSKPSPRLDSLRNHLSNGSVAKRWEQSGLGRSGSPLKYYRPTGESRREEETSVSPLVEDP